MSIDISKADIGVAIGTATAIAGILTHLKFDNSVTTALTVDRRAKGTLLAG